MKAKKYSVLIYPTAEKDLLEIKDYFTNKLKTSPNNLFSKLLEKIELIEDNPLIFPLCTDPNLNQLGYRLVPIDNFLLFYRIDENIVQIHRFIYGKRNYIEILK
jgi:addiction module RelE/StbE family toxin